MCNCTYYLSLLHSEKARRRAGRPLHALFLHVPPLAVVPLPRQMECLLDLLAAIAVQLAPSGAPEGGEGGAAAAEAAAEGMAAMGLADGTGIEGAAALPAAAMAVGQPALSTAAGALEM